MSYIIFLCSVFYVYVAILAELPEINLMMMMMMMLLLLLWLLLLLLMMMMMMMMMNDNGRLCVHTAADGLQQG